MPYVEYAKCPCCGKMLMTRMKLKRNLVIEIWVMIK